MLNINFFKPLRFLQMISLLMIIGVFVLLGVKGFRYGSDFTGGIEMTIEFVTPVETESLRSKLVAAGFSPDLEQIISREKTFKVRNLLIDEDPTLTEDEFEKFFTDNYPEASLQEIHVVGGLLSSQNKSNSIIISIVVILLIIAYLAFRFNISYSFSAIVAVIHDMLMMIGVVLVLDTEMTVLVIVAILTIFGYSVNDSIILFDRIRENKNSKKEYSDYKALLNESIRSVFSRTLITSFTTLIVVFSLFISTEGSYRDFAEILLAGIISGTYSSIYIACGFLMEWDKRKSLMKITK